MSNVLCYQAYSDARQEILSNGLGARLRPVATVRPDVADYFRGMNSSQGDLIVRRWASDTERLEKIWQIGSTVLVDILADSHDEVGGALDYRSPDKQEYRILRDTPVKYYVFQPGDPKLPWRKQTGARFIAIADASPEQFRDINSRFIAVEDYVYPESVLLNGKFIEDQFIGQAVDLRFFDQLAEVYPGALFGAIERARFLNDLGARRERAVNYAAGLLVAGRLTVGKKAYDASFIEVANKMQTTYSANV